MNNNQSINYDSITFNNSLELVPISTNIALYSLSALSIIVGLFLAVAINPFFIAVAPSVAIRLFTKKISKEKAAIYANFAHDNNWSTIVPSQDDLPLSIKGIGRNSSISNGISGTVYATPFTLFEYYYRTGTRKNSRGHFLTIARFKMSKSLPYMLLDSSKNNGGSRTIPSNAHHQSLEGDFDQYFKLYMQEGTGIGVLSFITPDVMQTLINSNSQQDIEIINDNLFIISVGHAIRKSSVEEIFNSSEKILGELRHKIGTYGGKAVSLHPTTELSQKMIPSRSRTLVFSLFILTGILILSVPLFLALIFIFLI